MKTKINQRGYINPGVAIGFTGFLALLFGGLAILAFMNYNTARTTLEEQKELAASEARAEQREQSEAEFAERLKDPYRAYTAPSVFGSITVRFPKNWNVYASESTRGSAPVDVTMHPELIRESENRDENIYAFRLQLQNKLYSDAVDSYARQVERGEAKAKTVTVSGIKGTRIDGVIEREITGSLVLIPVRDKTLVLWTESENYRKDFDKILQEADIN